MEFSRQEYWSGLPLPSPLEPVGIGQFLCQVKISVASQGTKLAGVAVRVDGAEL